MSQDDAETGPIEQNGSTSHVEPRVGYGGSSSPRSDDDGLLRAGEMLGAYKILSVLGEGGFGVVYRAEQLKPVRREVAMKVIKPGMDSRMVLSRFEAERQALAMMDHPCVAKVYDGGTDAGGRAFFAMEYVRGEPITSFCDRHKLGLAERLELFIRVCEAVQHAHTKGVVHRDLKPSNIMVGYEGDRASPKVIDFGVAKALHQKLTEATIFTQQGQLIGTPEYMSPEQAEMSGVDIDTRSDVYSLGVVLYELLTGALPFDSKTLRAAGYAEIQRIIREVEPPRPSTRFVTNEGMSGRVAERRKTAIKNLSGTLRRDLDWVVMRCLEKDRSRRYETARELAVEIGRYLRDEPVSAGPPSVSYRASKFVKRHRGGVAAGGVIAATLIGAAGVSTWFAVSESRARVAEAAARDRAETERAIAVAVNDFLNDDLLGAVDPDADGPEVTVASLLARAAAGSAERFEGTPEVEARVVTTLGTGYLRLGLPGEAEPLLRRASELLDAGELRTRVRLGLVESLWRRGQTEEALELATALDEETASLGLSSRLRLDVMNQLAAANKYAGELEVAVPMYREVLDARRELLGADHLETLRSGYNLAILTALRGIEARREGDESRAVMLLERSVEELRAEYGRARLTLGEEHSHTLVVLSELTSQLNRLNLIDEAEPLYERLLDAMGRRLGVDHWRRHQTLGNYARLLQRNGRYEQSLPMYEQTLAGYREWSGPGTARTAMITRRLAEVYERVGRVDDAVRVLARGYGDASGVVATELAGELAGVLNRFGRDDEARVWQERAGGV